jgi:hypothetical protein
MFISLQFKLEPKKEDKEELIKEQQKLPFKVLGEF